MHEARTDVSEWPLSASDLTMHAKSCLNPIMTWFHVTSIAKWRKMRRHWRVSLGERICTSSSTTPASCRYSHYDFNEGLTEGHSNIYCREITTRDDTVETHKKKKYWHWHISQSQSWTRLWIRITKCTYIQKRFSCSICIVSTTQWRLGLRISHYPLEALRAKLPHVLGWRHLLTVKLPRAAQNSACCDVQNTEHRYANVCVRCVQRDYLFIGTIDTEYLHGVAVQESFPRMSSPKLNVTGP